MKGISKILIVILVVLSTGCLSNQTIGFEHTDKSQVDGSVGRWVDSKATNGAYMAKDSQGKMLILYLNYMEEQDSRYYSVPSVSMNHKKKILTINSVPKLSQEPYNKVFIMTLNGNKVNKIILNQQEISIDQIEVLD